MDLSVCSLSPLVLMTLKCPGPAWLWWGRADMDAGRSLGPGVGPSHRRRAALSGQDGRWRGCPHAMLAHFIL